MKKLLLVFAFSAFGGRALYCQIPNSGFESWKNSNETIPEIWELFGTYEKTSGKSAGSALKLMNSTFDDLVSYSSQMRFDTSVFYKPAFAYAGNPDSVTVTFKPSLGMDTAYVSIGFTKTGQAVPISIADFMLTGNSGNWTTMTFAVKYVNPTPSLVADSGYVVISSADPVFGPLSSGSIEIDEITFKFQNNNPAPNIPNFSFDNWHSWSVEHPDAWATSGLFLQKQGFHFSNSAKTNDKYSGNTALELRGILVNDIDNNQTDTFPGAAITMRDPNNSDPSDVDLDHPAFPVSAKYKSVRGYLKSNLEGGDIFVAWLNFFSADSIVGSAIYVNGNDNAAYIEFSEDIAWDSTFSGTPDSATIALYVTDSSLTGINSLNSWAYVDDLRFDNWPTKINHTAVLKAGLYPNPANGNTTLKVLMDPQTAYKVTVVASDGKVVKNIEGIAGESKMVLPLDLQNLSTGIYTVKVFNEGKTHTEKLIVTK